MEHWPNGRLCAKSFIRISHLTLIALILDEEIEVQRGQVCHPGGKAGVEAWPRALHSSGRMTPELGMNVSYLIPPDGVRIHLHSGSTRENRNFHFLMSLNSHHSEACG